MYFSHELYYPPTLFRTRSHLQLLFGSRINHLPVLGRVRLERRPVGGDLEVFGVLARELDREPLRVPSRGGVSMLGKVSPHPHHIRTYLLILVCVDSVKRDEGGLPHEEELVGVTRPFLVGEDVEADEASHIPCYQLGYINHPAAKEGVYGKRPHMVIPVLVHWHGAL